NVGAADDTKKGLLVYASGYFLLSLFLLGRPAVSSNGDLLALFDYLLLPSLLGLAVVVVVGFVFGADFLRGADYLFVPHPPEEIVSRALARGDAIDGRALASALTPDPLELEEVPPAYHSENQARKVRALQRRVDAEAHFAQSVIDRERTRAAAEEIES